MNIWDVVVAVIVAVVVIAAIIGTVRNKNKCSCGCEGCSDSSCAKSFKSK